MVHAGRIAGPCGDGFSSHDRGARRDRACGASCTNVIYVLHVRYICLVEATYVFCMNSQYDLHRGDI